MLGYLTIIYYICKTFGEDQKALESQVFLGKGSGNESAPTLFNGDGGIDDMALAMMVMLADHVDE